MSNQGLAAWYGSEDYSSWDWLYTALFGRCDTITVQGGVAEGHKQ